MPVTLHTYTDDKTILIYTCTGDWTWVEFGAVDTSVWQQFHQSATRIDLIIDLSQSGKIPSGIEDVLHRVGQRQTSYQHALGLFVDAPLSLQIMVRAFKRMYPARKRDYLFADKLETAIAIIQQDRQNHR